MGSGKTTALREIIGSDEKLERVEMFDEMVLIRQGELYIGWRYTYGVTMGMLRDFVEMMCDKFKYLVLFNVDDIPVSWCSGLNSLVEFVNRRNVKVLCTCKSVSSLSSSFLSRFLRVRIRGFTDDEIIDVCVARLGKSRDFVKKRYDGFHVSMKGNMTLALFYIGMKRVDAESNKIVGLLGNGKVNVRKLMEEPLELCFVLRLLSYKYSYLYDLVCSSEISKFKSSLYDLVCLCEISKLKHESRDIQCHMIEKFIHMKENSGVLEKKSF
jgi:hypothetical protein